MTLKKIVFAAPVALALVLSGCGGGSSTPTANVYCPTAFTVQDAGRITHFKPGGGRDPRDIEYEASLVSAATQCELKRKQMNVTLVMRIAVNAGPSVTGAPTQVPYFVRVLTGAGTVAQGQDFIAGFKLSAANPRGQSQEELVLTLPYSQPNDLSAYRIAVGLKPTQEELDYNRRMDGRQ
ncbi:hypothetical protein [Reyranella sp.]|uniref:hypothetical protein n=1 Tax=Reyranella sp. TaxID=1929291 RepID=UPI0011FEB632|nr:hypothetical protein [Reyranella sp.]TAJ82925.1 MAG: hypothetical protein EPO50_24815 [Reyranella sp.]